MKKVLVIDGQGGKIGKSIVEQLVALQCPCQLTVVGTNTAATAAMMKAGAAQGATGENPVVVNAAAADIITGPIGILAANALLGEITPKMALAVSESGAHKVLIPVTRCSITVAGVEDLPVGEYIARAARQIAELCR